MLHTLVHESIHGLSMRDQNEMNWVVYGNLGVEEGLADAYAFHMMPKIAERVGLDPERAAQQAERMRGLTDYGNFVDSYEGIRKTLGMTPDQFYPMVARTPVSMREMMLRELGEQLDSPKERTYFSNVVMDRNFGVMRGSGRKPVGMDATEPVGVGSGIGLPKVPGGEGPADELQQFYDMMDSEYKSEIEDAVAERADEVRRWFELNNSRVSGGEGANDKAWTQDEIEASEYIFGTIDDDWAEGLRSSIGPDRVAQIRAESSRRAEEVRKFWEEKGVPRVPGGEGAADDIWTQMENEASEYIFGTIADGPPEGLSSGLDIKKLKEASTSEEVAAAWDTIAQSVNKAEKKTLNSPTARVGLDIYDQQVAASAEDITVDRVPVPYNKSKAYKLRAKLRRSLGLGANHDDFGDEILTLTMRERGLDAPTDVVSDKELDKQIAKGAKEIFRGVLDTPQIEEFKSGDYVAGNGVNGNGFYATTAFTEARWYALGSPGGFNSGAWRRHGKNWLKNVDPKHQPTVGRMAIKPDAKVMDIDRLSKEQHANFPQHTSIADIDSRLDWARSTDLLSEDFRAAVIADLEMEKRGEGHRPEVVRELKRKLRTALNNYHVSFDRTDDESKAQNLAKIEEISRQIEEEMTKPRLMDLGDLMRHPDMFAVANGYDLIEVKSKDKKDKNSPRSHYVILRRDAILMSDQYVDPKEITD
jgi:hypothetical protein